MAEPLVFGDVEVGTAFAPDDWKQAMGAFASGVVIVTTLDEGRPVGTTVSAFSSVSLHPPLLLVCLDHKSRTRAAVRKAGNFCINILAAGQGDLAKTFAGPGAVDRFRDLECEPGGLGAPHIPGALASIDCRLHSLHGAGDHDILIGRGLAIRSQPGEPLIYSQGRFLGQ